MRQLRFGSFIAAGLCVFAPLAAQTGASVRKGLYLGQAGPGSTPSVFAPGIISLPGRYEYACSFSPDGRTFLFTAEVPEKPSVIMISELEKDVWTPPREVLLGTTSKGEMEASFGPDGKLVYFAAMEETGCSIWKAARQGRTWAKAEKLGSAVNTGIVFYPILTGDGTLYFTDVRKRKTYRSIPKNGEYDSAEPVDLEFGVHAFVARDESTLVMDFQGDLYACFRLKSGRWSSPRKLGPAVCTPEFNETCPSLSPDGRVLFFSRYDEKGKISNLYWVSSTELDAMRMQEQTQ